MKRENILRLLPLAATLLLTGCMAEDGLDDSVAPLRPSIEGAQPVIHTMIRFEDTDGGNLMSAVEDIRRDRNYYLFEFEEYPWLDVRCIRGSDGAEMTYSSVGWHYPSDPDELLVYGQGPVLILCWLDVDKLAGQNVRFPAHDSYTLRIRNTLVWPDAERTVTWGIDFPTRYTFDVVSCAIDGVDSPQCLSEASTDSGRFLGLVRLRTK